MKSIYKTILSKFFSASLIPIFFIEISLILALFWMNERHTSATKESLESISSESFSEIAEHTAQQIQQQFIQVQHEISQLTLLANRMFAYPGRYSFKELKLYYDQGFYRDGKKKGLSSVYTTNLNKLKAEDSKRLELLSLLQPHLEHVVKANEKLIQSAWINLSKYQSLFYPPIDVPNELSSDLDVTKQRFYFEADPSHNPKREIRFLPLYGESWAAYFGQMGAYLSPLYAGDRFIGVIGVSVTVNKGAETFMQMKLPFNAYAMLVDEQNRLLLSSDEKRSFKDVQVRSFYQNYRDVSQGREGAPLMPVDTKMFAQRDKLIFSKAIEGTSFSILFCADYDDIYGPLEQMSQKTRLIGLYIIGAITLFYLLYFLYMFKSVRSLARKISDPVRRIVSFSSKLGEDEPLIVETSEVKELRLLNDNLNQTHERLIRLVNYDEATGLFNHRKLQLDIAKKRRILIFFKLTNFDHYNNIFGHHIGEAALAGMIEILKRSVTQAKFYRENRDTVAVRLDIEQESMKALLKEVLESITGETISCEGIDISLTVAAGVALGSCEDGIDLIGQAHIALSEALQHAVGGFVIYDEVHNVTKRYEENLQWSREVKEALREGRMVAFFQPILNYHSGRVEKFESLVRMKRDDAFIAPYRFLSAAASIGKLHEITLTMVDQVFERARHFPDIEFSINTSFEDFEQMRLIEVVKKKLADCSVCAGNIIFEILETQTFEDEATVSRLITELKAMGFKVAIDDFGTGHSNFAHISMMDVDYVKIDGRFIKDLEHDELSFKTVNTIVSFAQQIGAKTIAEYVHNEAVFKKCQMMGIDYAQGYYLSEPLPQEALEGFLKERE